MKDFKIGEKVIIEDEDGTDLARIVENLGDGWYQYKLQNGVEESAHEDIIFRVED